ncbi:MAG: large repetitive protein [Blastocatellia bacterium]|nr:large repetitive protein [Blastocatellia bacterium]
MKPQLKNLVAFASLIAILLGASADARVLEGTVGAGTVISNRAEAVYRDEAGESFSTVSPTVTVTISTVAAIVVTPDETTPSATVAPREQITRLFRVCNTGNTPDTFTPIRADVTAPATLTSLHFDNDGSGTLTEGDTLIRVNESSSPQLSPGDCMGVLAQVDTNDAPAQSTLTINLVARSNAVGAVNGRGEDAGMILNTVGIGPRLTDPDNPNLPPVNLINGKAQDVIAIGATVTISIAFKNIGDTSARSVTVTEALPDGVDYLADSLQISSLKVAAANKSAPLSALNNSVVVRLPEVAAGETVRLSFRLHVTGKFSGGTGVLSGAVITADNLLPTKTGDAVMVVSPFGVVFAGRAGSSTPIASARMEIASDQNAENLLPLPADDGFAPNEKNQNPFLSDAQGQFSFKLGADVVGNESSTASYFLKVTAQGFITRMLQLGLRPTRAGLFSLTVHAADSQPLAAAGGYDLVREDVRINDLAALVLNIPMFEPAGLQIVKSADRARAEIGDTITYRVEVHNPTAADLKDVVVKDLLPPSFHYATGSALISVSSATDTSIEPEIAGNELRFRVSEIPHGATARILYRVRVGANAREGDQENVATAFAVFPSGEQIQSAQARAVVYVSAGVFSTRQVLLGRVFIDTNGNGQFDESDRPVPGVRLYLSNGQSVITDSAGLYNFPSLGDGPQVISLDPVSVPKHYALTDGGRLSGKSWARLLRTPIGGGALLRQNFALVDTHKLQSKSEPYQATDVTNKTEVAENAKPAPTPLSTSTAKTTTNAITVPGTYELTSTETISAVAAGEVLILSPATNSVSMSASMQTEVRVALNWTVKLEVNGEQISDQNIGVRSLDHKNQVSTFTFVGLNLKPGPNRIRCTAIGPNGATGHTVEIAVIGRGPARRLEIVPERSEIQSGGSDSTIVLVKAFDEWGNPALDGQVGVETSLGQLMRSKDKVVEQPEAQLAKMQSGLAQPLIDQSSQQSNQQTGPGSQVVVQLEGGQATLKLISSGTPGEARLRAQTGEIEAKEQVRITSEVRPSILVGFAEMSFGKSIPEVGLRDEQGQFRRRLSFFYSGRLPGNNMLTLSYDSQRPINRTAGRDRMFQMDPLDRVYPLFGDSSTRYEAAASNSKLYVRVDHKRSYAMFGDFEADMEAPLAGYSRKLTGVKAHLENSAGDFITVTGARPDTAFARDVFPAGSLGILQLSNGEILPGSETVVLEIRDRRNPEVITSRETLVRSVDYNLDAASGQMFFMRYISTFDSALNLTQVVVTYEHRAANLNSAVYTARARKNFKGIGLKLGLSAVLQKETDQGAFLLGGFDAEKTLPRGGSLQLAWAGSQGQIMGSGNGFGNDDTKHDGMAYQLTLAQPLPFLGSTLKARYLNSSAGFFNPFGGTVTPGSRRGEVTLEMKPRANSTLHFGVTTESNHTANVDNGRLTFSAAWDQILNERIKFHLGFDHRAFTDDLNSKRTDSNLITAGAEVQVTDKLQFSVKREQNLNAADPTYPTQTTLGATYQINTLTKIFFSQRLAAAPITPIGDYSGTGFAAVTSKRETAFGVETRFGKYTSMTGRYQVENGINGTDSFAVIGLQDRLPITKTLSLELGFERGFHVAGPNKSFNSAAFGFAWQPNSDFRASARYEYRDRDGAGQLLAAGAAGKLREGITALSRIQWSRGAFGGKSNSALEGSVALAIRPLTSDRVGVLFSYTHRSLIQDATSATPTRDRLDSLSVDGYNQLTKRLEVYGRFALRFSANGQPQLPFVSTLSFLTQARAQYLVTRRLDWAVETRLLFQPSSRTMRSVYATEAGFWVLPDMRLGLGYNFTAAKEPSGSQVLPTHKGFYFTISSKLSNLFDLFGTSRQGLISETEARDLDSKSEPK